VSGITAATENFRPGALACAAGRLRETAFRDALVVLQEACVKKKTLSFLDVLRFVAGYWRNQPAKFATILLLLAVSAGLEAFLPTALSRFLAAARQGAAHSVIIAALAVFLGIYLVQAVLYGATFFLYNNFETRTFQTVMDDVFRHVHRLSEHFFVNTFAGSIISRINRARNRIETFEDRLLVDLYPTGLVLVGSMIFLGRQFPTLALLITAYLALLLLVSGYFIFRISGPAQGTYADAQDHFIAHMADSISGMATTKAYARGDYEVERFADVTLDLRTVNRRAYYLSNLAGFVQRLLLSGMLALLLAGGTWYFFHGQATVEGMAYLAYAYMIMQSYVQRLGFQIKDVLTASYDLHAVILLLQEAPEAPAAPHLPPLTIGKGAIEFDNVRFAYPGKAAPVFDGFSVSIKAGERVALVGHSGSGKTTFIRLLQRLYDLQGGRIAIEGQDIAAHSLDSLRGAIALVPQDPILFHRSLADNIAYARPEASRAEIEAAARQAHIHDFIETLPQRYETLVGERGIKLSGGERQRIAIARAILADRPILILDEATSSLDSVGERAIQEALRSLTHGRTSIMIAHRLSTILDADRILVFDGGRIVEEGTHAQLLAVPDGIYARLFNLQSGGFIAE
jgi:ATP-binding cassette subfamily B protein